MTIKTLKTAACAGALMSAVAWSGGAFAAGASGDSYDFETSGTLGTGDYVALAGNGTVDDATYTYSARAGKPISSTASTKVLTIAGTVTYTNSAASVESSSSQVDFMFKVEPTDELENPDGTDIQVALAVGETNATPVNTAPIKLWCKTTTSGDAGWVTIKESVNAGAWIRATLVLDYSDTTYKKCKVSLDGDPVKNGDSEWFFFAGTTVNQQFVKSISMVGSTQIDELKVSYAEPEAYVIPTQGGSTTVADSGPASAVTYDYINKYGVTVAEATSGAPLNAESGMSVADKFAAGLDPKSSTKFALQTMTTDKTTATVTFPGTKPVGNYKVSAKTAGGTEVATGTITKSSTDGENVNSAAITIPEANQNELLYFTVETVTE